MWNNFLSKLQGKAIGLNRKWGRGLARWSVLWCEETGALEAELMSYKNGEALPDNHMLPQRCLIADQWTLVISGAVFFSKPPAVCCLTKIQQSRGVSRHAAPRTQSEKLKTNSCFQQQWVSAPSNVTLYFWYVKSLRFKWLPLRASLSCAKLRRKSFESISTYKQK